MYYQHLNLMECLFLNSKKIKCIANEFWCLRSIFTCLVLISICLCYYFTISVCVCVWDRQKRTTPIIWQNNKNSSNDEIKKKKKPLRLNLKPNVILVCSILYNTVVSCLRLSSSLFYLLHLHVCRSALTH